MSELKISVDHDKAFTVTGVPFITFAFGSENPFLSMMALCKEIGDYSDRMITDGKKTLCIRKMPTIERDGQNFVATARVVAE